jgi:glycosyltransferase involved in cell wall biosynthesis
VRQSTDQPVRVRFEHTCYPQWGGHSGYAQFVRCLDPASFRTFLHGASDRDPDLPRWLRRFKPSLKRLIARGKMPWYKISDLNAEMLALAECLRRRFDLVHFLDGEHSGQFLPRLLRFLGPSSVRTVVTFHQPPSLLRGLVNPELLRWFDQVVVVSPSQLEFFKPHVAEDRLQVILHGVDTDFFHPAAAARRGDGIRCITVGDWLRDWSSFAAVARAMGDVAFDVVTGTKPDLSGLDNVRLYSGLDDGALAELYRRADILFLPLKETTANNALLEGIATGLPVVATDLEATRAYLPSGEAILVADNRTEGFIEAIRGLQRNVALRREMGRRARLRAEELAWPRLACHYERLYRRTIRRPPVGRGRANNRIRSALPV